MVDDVSGDSSAVYAGPRVAVPAHGRRAVAWRQAHRGGTVDDRTLREVTVSIPPHVAGLDPRVPNDVLAECDLAVRTIAHLDETGGAHLRPLATLLLRAESVASSKIEHEDASIEDFARALHGVKANSSATSMVAASGAIDRLLGGPIDTAGITAAHRLLMADDPTERGYAGRWREVQNWIGGSDHSPRNALYVPPPADLVEELMGDLIAFARRTDLPVIVQAAIAHAQFESIHPFTDGNGRIGRALAAAVIRERGVAQHVVIPIASALVARREHYFDTLNHYRAGDAGPIVHAFARSAIVASQEATLTADRLAAMPEQWHRLAGAPRMGSATAEVLASLPAAPIFTADDLETRLGLSTASTYRAIERLADTEVIRPLTDRTRNQIWGTGDLLDELHDLGVRIGARSGELLAPPGGAPARSTVLQAATLGTSAPTPRPPHAPPIDGVDHSPGTPSR
ncbi:Fic family protein [Nocardioides sp. BE266]|uniref:Fic family protein n=1 Tax=Nocardioides sp. BE266 TaxID=2817725 RepID=UPI002856CFE5|nr:Fic family protein [Nocardioides sp. BE266]MDR7254932.1 Fic family protein [Nocardioides sp. BE266]